MQQPIEIGADAIADRERPFRRLDQPMNMSEALRLLDREAVEDAEDDETGEALRRRLGVVMRAAGERQPQRLAPHRAVVLQVGPGAARLDQVHVRGKLATDIAAIKIVEADVAEMLQRRGQRRVGPQRSGSRQLAVDQIGLGEARRLFQHVEFEWMRPRL